MKKILVAIIIILLSLNIVSINAQSLYVSSLYTVIDNQGKFFTLNVTVSESLFGYYAGLKNPTSLDEYVTPLAVKPIADILRTVSYSDEDFVNQVLKWNRQHKYEITNACYPAETLYTGKGDCDTFTYLVASVLIAGKVSDLCLITYEISAEERHMNLGVYLPEQPVDYGFRGLYWITFNNKPYYIAECTDQTKDPTRDSYKLGNMPSVLNDKEILKSVSITNYKTDAPEQVIAYFLNTELTTISISATEFAPTMIYPIIIKGNIGVSLNNEKISLYYSHDKTKWYLAGETVTVNGDFVFSWFVLDKVDLTARTVEFIIPEKVYIKAYWAGNTEYQGGVSEIVSSYVFPMWIVFAIIFILILMSLNRRRK